MELQPRYFYQNLVLIIALSLLSANCAQAQSAFQKHYIYNNKNLVSAFFEKAYY